MKIKKLFPCEIYADTEFTTEKTSDEVDGEIVSKTHFFIWKEKGSNEVKLCKTAQEFFTALLEDGRSKTVWFHNLTADFGTFRNYLFENFKFTSHYEDIKNKTYTYFSFKGRLLYIRLNKYVRVGKNVKQVNLFIRDSLRFLQLSIKEWGKNFGIENKQEEEFYDQPYYDKIEDYPKTYVDYAKNDVIILEKSLNAFSDAVTTLVYKLFNTYINPYSYLTISSYVKRIWEICSYRYAKRHKLKKVLGLRIPANMHEIGHQLMRGGFSFVNPVYRDKKNRHAINEYFAMLDINADYCHLNSLSIPTSIINEGKDRLDNTFCECGFKFKIKKEYKNFPIISYRDVVIKSLSHYDKKHKTQYPLKGEFYGWIWMEELEYVKEFYEINKIEYYSYLNTVKMPFMYDFYAKGYQERQANFGAVKFALKVLLNCGWGVFALYEQEIKKHFTDNKYDKGFILPNGEKIVGESLTDLKYQNVFKHCYWREKASVSPNKLKRNNIMASYIPMLGRCKLYQAIIDCGPENVVMGVTDSITVKISKSDYLKAKFNKPISLVDKLDVGNEMGQWSLKLIGKRLNVLRKLAYCLEGDNSQEIHMSGVCNSKEEIKKFLFEGEEVNFKKKKLRYTKDSSVIENKDVKIKI